MEYSVKQYSTSFLQAISDSGFEDQIRMVGRLKLMVRVLESETIRNVFINPSLLKDDKQKFFDYLAKLLNFDTKVIRFLQVIFDRQSYNLLKRVSEETEKQFKINNNLLTIEIETPIALSRAQREDITKKIESSFKQKIRVKEIINRNLLGGIIVRINGFLMDLSWRKKLKYLQKLCLEN